MNNGNSIDVLLERDSRNIQKRLQGFVMTKPLIPEQKVSYIPTQGKGMRRAESAGEDFSSSVLPKNVPVQAKPRRFTPQAPTSLPAPLSEQRRLAKYVDGGYIEPGRYPAVKAEPRVTYKPTPHIPIDDLKPVPRQAIEPVADKVVRQVKLPKTESLSKSISKISNMMRDFLHSSDIFNEIKPYIKDKKLFPETFYQKAQNAIYHSLIDFCEVTKDENKNIILPDITEYTSYIPTLWFFDRIFNSKSVSFEKTAEKLMAKYRRTFHNNDGIQVEWVELLRTKLSEKMPVEAYGIDQMVEILSDLWCMKITPVLPEPEPVPTSSVEFLESPLAKDDDDEDDDEYYDDDDDDDEDDEPSLTIDVEISKDEDGINTMIINSLEVSIPIYFTLDEIYADVDPIPSLSGDDRNGIWDWLIHFEPNNIFVTKDPQQYLDGNVVPESLGNIKCVILDVIEESEYVIGIYDIDEELGKDALNDIDVKHINYLVLTHISDTNISHLRKTLSQPELFTKEEDLLEHVDKYNAAVEASEDEVEEGEESEEVNDDDDEEVDLAALAVDSLEEEEASAEEVIPEEEEDEEIAVEVVEEVVEEEPEMNTSVVTIAPSADEDNEYYDDDDDAFVFKTEPYRKKNRSKSEE